MFLGFLLTSLGISTCDIILLKCKDIETCKKIKEKLESYDYKIISNSNIRKEVWNILFSNKNKIGSIEKDDINMFYDYSLIPVLNIVSLYHNLSKKNSDINDTFNFCVDECLNDNIIKKLFDNNIIRENYEWFDDEPILKLERKKNK